MVRFRKTMLFALLVAALAVLVPGAPAAQRVRNVKVTTGTTALTLDPAAASNLQSMGVAMTAVAPATTAGQVLTFAVKSGSARVKGTRILSGRFVHTGSLQMAKDTTVLAVGTPTVTFGPKPSLSGTMAGMSVDIGTLDLKKAKVTLTARQLKISGVGVSLTSLAAGAMNAAFGVTGFKAGDRIGVATLTAKVKAR